jgi:hypothetical protein
MWFLTLALCVRDRILVFVRSRGWRDFAGTRPLALLRESIYYRARQYRSSHRPEDADPLQNIIVQHYILILLSFVVVLPVVSSAVFLS